MLGTRAAVGGIQRSGSPVKGRRGGSAPAAAIGQSSAYLSQAETDAQVHALVADLHSSLQGVGRTWEVLGGFVLLYVVVIWLCLHTGVPPMPAVGSEVASALNAMAAAAQPEGESLPSKPCPSSECLKFGLERLRVLCARAKLCFRGVCRDFHLQQRIRFLQALEGPGPSWFLRLASVLVGHEGAI